MCSILHDPKNCSPVRLLCPWAFSRQEYWSGLPCHPPRDLPNPGTKPASLMSSILADEVFTISTTWQGHKTGLVRPKFLKLTSYFRFETYQKNLMFLLSLKNSIENSLSYFCRSRAALPTSPLKERLYAQLWEIQSAVSLWIPSGLASAGKRCFSAGHTLAGQFVSSRAMSMYQCKAIFPPT